jgi:hypothetical protein
MHWFREAASGLALALLTLAVLLAAPLADPDFSLIADDGHSSFQPILTDSLRQLKQGKLPLWSDYTKCGYPLLARGQQSIYPPHFLAHGVCLLGGWWAQEMYVSYLLHVVFAVATAFLYLRYLGAHWVAAAVGAVGFGLCGPLMGFGNNWPPYGFLLCLVPAALLVVERVCAGPAGGFWVAAYGLVNGMVFLITDPMLVVKFHLLVGLYFLLRVDRSAYFRPTVTMLKGFVLAVLIGAGQMLATVHLVGATTRVTSSGVATWDAFRMSCPPWGYLGLFFPWVRFEWQNSICASFTGGAVFAGPLFGLGLVTYLLTSRRPDSAPMRALLALIVLYFLLSLGAYFPPNHLLQQLPVFRQFRWPVRWTLEVGGLAALFTGLSLSRLIDLIGTPVARQVGWVCAALVGVVAAVCLPRAAGAFPPWALPVGLAWLACFAVILAVLLAGRKQIFLVAAPLFTLAALAANLPVAQQIRFVRPDLRHLGDDPLLLPGPEESRFLYLAMPGEQVRFNGGLPYSLPHLYQTHSVEGYSYSLAWQWWIARITGIGLKGEIQSREDAEYAYLSRESNLRQILRMAWVVVPRQNEELRRACESCPDLEPSAPWSTPTFAVFRNRGFRASAFFVREIRDEEDLKKPVADDPEVKISPEIWGPVPEEDVKQVEEELRISKRFTRLPLSSVCVVEGENYHGPRQFDGSGKVEHFEEDNGVIRVKVDTPAAGFLALTTTYYPGWQAFLDGRPVPVHRTNIAFMGVEVPAGGHTVELVFRPWGTILLVLLGILVELLLLVYCLVAAGRKWRAG